VNGSTWITVLIIDCYKGMHQNGSQMLNEALPKPRIVHASKQVVQRKTDADSAAQTDAATQKGEFPLSGQQFGHYTLMRQPGQRDMPASTWLRTATSTPV
jgi:hypothetical protein